MRGTDFFLQYYNCSLEEFIELIAENPNIYIPQYLCAHPRNASLQHIKELIFSFIQPCPPSHPCHFLPIICLCYPIQIDDPLPGTSHLSPDQLFLQIERAWVSDSFFNQF